MLVLINYLQSIVHDTHDKQTSQVIFVMSWKVWREGSTLLPVTTLVIPAFSHPFMTWTVPCALSLILASRYIRDFSFCLLCGYFSDPLRFKRFPLTPSFQLAMDRKNNHTANKNKQSKYGKLYFIEHSSEYLSIWIFYLNSHTNPFEILYTPAILNYAIWNYMCQWVNSHTELGRPVLILTVLLEVHRLYIFDLCGLLSFVCHS